MSALEVVRMLEALDPSIEVNNLGESDFIIAYKPPTFRSWDGSQMVLG